MKKTLFLSLLMGLALFSQAQSFSISYNGETVGTNDTLQLIATGDELKLTPVFTNNNFVNFVCKVSVESLNSTTSFVSSICTGDYCREGNESAPFDFPGNTTISQVYVDFYVPEDAAPGLYRMTIFDTNNHNINASCYAMVYNTNTTLDAHPAEAFLTTSCYPNPASDLVTITYNMNDDNGRIIVTDLTGRIVIEQAVSGKQGTAEVSLEGLPKGMYLYGILNSGRTSIMKKLIVH